MIQSIDHINIVVSDLEEAKKFFLDLSFELISEDNLEGKWINKVVKLDNVRARYCAFKIGESQTKLELIQYFNPEGNTDINLDKANSIGYRHIAFQVKDIEILYDRLKKKNVAFLSEVQKYKTGKKLCYFYGPDNIILELAEYI
ncbi:hypothetical protein BH09PAT2_BH09PAT2_09400 [soil metagenome]